MLSVFTESSLTTVGNNLRPDLTSRDIVPFAKIGIIGLGLIGGSIAKTIKRQDLPISVSTLKRDSGNNRQALREGWIKIEFNNLRELLLNIDLLILATPIRIVIPLAENIRKIPLGTGKRLIVIDVASVKEPIARAFEKLSSEQIEFIATHPMAGSEQSGFQSAQADLFHAAPWIITPHKKNSPEALQKVEKFLRFLGAKTKLLTEKKHDRQVALVSHLSFVIATSLFAYVFKTDKESIKLSGPGFRSLTRLASGNSTMHGEIVQNNRKNLEKYLGGFREYLRQLSLFTEKPHQYFEQYRRIRDNFFRGG